ncbi:MAG: response regulator transcription factor [Bacteroidales bacterium]|nr:response regulator transcription factor [Bacteroidales bacterium]
MIRTLIIEDEETAATRLENLLQRIEPEINIVGRLDSVEASVKWLQSNPAPDLLMLDIQLGDGLSFEIFRKVKVDSFVIFTTAYDEYAIKAFGLNSIDYLLKPVEEAKLKLSLEKFNKLRSTSTSIDIEKIVGMIESRKSQFKKRFVVNIADKIKMVETREVAYFYTMEKFSFLCTLDNFHFPLEFSLDHLESLLDPEFFYRVNRQYIINFSSISKILLLSKSRIKIEVQPPIKDGLMVSSARTPEFRKWLDR